MDAITFTQLSSAQAEAQFPGCITEDILELIAENHSEPGYHKLGTLDGRLFSMCNEISFLSWSVWEDGAWWDLDDVDNGLFMRLEEAEVIDWVTCAG